MPTVEYMKASSSTASDQDIASGVDLTEPSSALFGLLFVIYSTRDFKKSRFSILN
jgi:hypothetical protein